LFAALMNLHMLVATPGRERTMHEYATLLTGAGFVEPGVQVLAGIRDIVYARKPSLAS
jgi:O-methyltransferase domain